jgi:hypothetical protein
MYCVLILKEDRDVLILSKNGKKRQLQVIYSKAMLAGMHRLVSDPCLQETSQVPDSSLWGAALIAFLVFYVRDRLNEQRH